MGVALADNGNFYLCEKTGNGWGWYSDYTSPVNLPKYLKPGKPGVVQMLSGGTQTFDYVYGSGHQNIGVWIDAAAQRMGR